MFLVKPSFEILNISASSQFIELCGRTCYKSEDRITKDSSIKFIKDLLKRGHHSVIEHSSISVRFIIDRGVSHELVRHRLCAFSQESTRYCNYAKKGVTFIIPPWIDIEEGEYEDLTNHYRDSPGYWWAQHMLNCEDAYLNLLTKGWSSQQARSVLPNSLKTEIIVTANVREWRHILKLRTSSTAHPQMQEIMISLLEELRKRIPVLFEEL